MSDDSDSHDEHHRNAFDGYEPNVARLCKIRREEDAEAHCGWHGGSEHQTCHYQTHGCAWCTSCIHVCELSVVERMTHREWLLEGVQVGRLESDSVSFRNEGCRQLLVRLLRQRSQASGLMLGSPATLPFRGLGAGAEESQQGVAAVSGAWEAEMWDNRLFERKCEHVHFHGTCK